MSFNPLPHIQELNRLRNVIKQLPTQVGVEAVEFFKAGFNMQGWQGDSGLEPWKERKISDIGSTRKILIGKGTGNLRKGITKRVMGDKVLITVEGVASKYADTHNFGATINIPVTKKMRRWAWAMYYNTRDDSPSLASMYKAIALTRKPHVTIKVPKRQFIGTSTQLERRLKDLIRRKLEGI